jgi:hypothetical protein
LAAESDGHAREVLETRTTTDLPSAADVLRVSVVVATQVVAIVSWAILTVWMLLSLLRWMG